MFDVCERRVPVLSCYCVQTVPDSFSCSVADLGEGPGGPGPPYFETKLRPQGPKKFFGDPPPLIPGSGRPPPSRLSEGLDPPLMLARKAI